jgi:5-methylcytosine-specific restriction endonuclease McrA
MGVITVKDGKRAFSKEQKQQVCALQDNQCACCGEELDPDNTSSYEGDHIVPHSKGGKTTIDNCEVLCLSCHQIKTKLPEQYSKLRGKKAKSAKRKK